jgi:hypothetical protein
MAFADPTSITINAVATSFPRVGSGPYLGQFQTADGLRQFKVQHALGKRTRHVMRLDSSKFVADTFIPANTARASMSVSLVIDVPLFGYTVADAVLEARGLVDYAAASSGSKITQLLGNES